MSKFSQLAFIFNVEIPINFNIINPEEAAAMLATIEVINEQKKEQG